MSLTPRKSATFVASHGAKSCSSPGEAELHAPILHKMRSGDGTSCAGFNPSRGLSGYVTSGLLLGCTCLGFLLCEMELIRQFPSGCEE